MVTTLAASCMKHTTLVALALATGALLIAGGDNDDRSGILASIALSSDLKQSDASAGTLEPATLNGRKASPPWEVACGKVLPFSFFYDHKDPKL